MILHLSRLIIRFREGFPMEVGNKVKPGEAVAADIYVRKSSPES